MAALTTIQNGMHDATVQLRLQHTAKSSNVGLDQCKLIATPAQGLFPQALPSEVPGQHHPILDG